MSLSWQPLLCLRPSNGGTAGGMQGLTNAMMKAWPPEIIYYVYGLLLSHWADKMVPGWWWHLWLIPLPKKPANPTLDELRPIVLLEKE